MAMLVACIRHSRRASNADGSADASGEPETINNDIGQETMSDGAMAASAVESSRAVDRDWPAVVAAACGLIFSVGTLTVYSFGVFIHPLAKEFGWTRTQLSGAVAISQYGLAVSSPVWGLLVDRFGPRAILLISIAVLGVLAASLSLLTPHLWHLYLVFAALPLFAGGATPLGYSAVLVRRFERHLGLALGLALMGVGLGAAIIPPLAQALLGGFGWRHAYVMIGGICLVVGVPAALIATRNTRGPVIRQVGVRKQPVAPMLRTRAFILMCVAFLLLGIATVGALAHLVPMMADRGFTPAAAARVAGLTGLAALIGRGGNGWVLDRVQAPRMLAVLALLAACGFLLLVYGEGRASGYTAAILLGGVIGAEVDFIAFLIRRHFVQAVFGRLYGIAFGIYMVGAGTGPLLLGESFDRLGGYQPGLLLFTALAVIADATALAIRKYDRLQPTAGLV